MTLDISTMIGKTMASVTGKPGDEEMVFVSADGWKFRFYHQQGCCEEVAVNDVTGDISDLIGSPITQAEMPSNEDNSYEKDEYGSCTWTFYKFATNKGSVTVRWLGESNGYYSEEVDLDVTPPTA